LVEEGEMVARELIHVALTRQELWHEGLEEASRLYFGGGEGGGAGGGDVRAAVLVLESLHVKLGGTGLEGAGGGEGGREGGEIRSVLAFSHAYERELAQAYVWLCRYKLSGLEADMCQVGRKGGREGGK